ncbi:LacI family DNA-binding transcriptional regulator [Saccharibacillus sp. CPCC 101409]|uniref:LacI family DNA-binding transcriptional regulator n=1 Tax=Saccharibacillus sp. CPCC 101409 TaxID=3058041 RepID=UPI0026715398|nr:LacI family DNA-binding transcriptional regulator [Saccharibacillus sp. CPCC 101409]MDO3412693.1 LacI family DNA-binding transcriptional regulator [Saccharibacillus sp. CPCC 101409]
MTLKEIAEQAGVSISTVSRIINSSDDSFARKSVRDRVWKIIHETGYVPNQSARELKQGKREEVPRRCTTVSCILGRTRDLEDNPFFAQTARAVEQQALEKGCIVSASYSIFDLQGDPFGKRMDIPRADGAVVLGRFNENTRLLLEKHYKNIVYVGRNPIDAEWDQIVCDGYEAAKTALDHLIGLGHKRIAYIGETQNEIRYRAFADAVRRHKLDGDANLVASFPQDGPGGYEGADYLLRSASPFPTAVFCATDITAIAAVKRFLEAGIKIPQQLSVVSMDDIEIAQYMSPVLTTVSIPKVEMGKVAVRTLLDRINKEHRLPMKIFLPHKLLVRESTAKPHTAK